ncbi:MAG: MvaI/BcnI family restriction endonuclease [candidate division KSB1 bacterium]|nr:MvaI/BcnI family restriction endonuclease [candidate division KSB1 bacterium]
MTLSEFINAFGALKAKNWVKSERRGPTGIGHTLEKLIGLPENNIASPDLGTIELKAHRINSNSMITLFTFNRKVWKMKPLEAIKNTAHPMQMGGLVCISQCLARQTAQVYFCMSRTKPYRFATFRVK